MDEPYTVRPFVHGDEESIIDLLKTVFPEWANRKSPVDYWRWKYLSPPLGSIIHVACYDGEIVGISHDILFNMKLGDSIYTCNYGDDAATYPSHQGKGIYRMINQMNDKEQDRLGSKLGYSIPLHPAFARTSRPDQFFLPQAITHVIRVKDPEKYLKAKNVSYSRLKSLGFWAMRGVTGLESSYIPSSKRASNLEIKVVESFDGVDDLWRSVSMGLNFSVVRNDVYLNWRYCDSRAGKFIVMQASEEGALVGYAVAEIKGLGDEAEAYLMDLLSLSGRLDIAFELAKRVVKFLEDLGLNSINFRAAEGHPSLAMLKRLGFVSIPEQQRMIVKVTLRSLPIQLFDKVKESSGSMIHFGYGDYV